MVLPWIYPLDEFYAREGLPLPKIERVAGADIPEPYRSLLVHGNDMTPTLQGYHGSMIHLEVLRSDPRGDFYFREVMLRLDRDDAPVEFGANKINLSLFASPAKRLILEERLPLGQILKQCDVPHTTAAKAFLRVETDSFIGRSMGLSMPRVLYGRRATIWDLQRRPLSEIVEILPPIDVPNP
jgi:chorismate-pyruvate lyase